MTSWHPSWPPPPPEWEDLVRCLQDAWYDLTETTILPDVVVPGEVCWRFYTFSHPRAGLVNGYATARDACLAGLVLAVREHGFQPESLPPRVDVVRKALKDYGWGPRVGPVVFQRQEQGWQLGNGVVTTVFRSPNENTDDPDEALLRIVQDCNETRRSIGCPLLPVVWRECLREGP